MRMLLQIVLLFSSSLFARDLTVGVDAPSLAETLAMARNGDLVLVPQGQWKGGVTISKTIALKGQGGVIDGGGEGTVLTIDAPDVVVEGLTISGSGDNLSGPDCGVYTTKKATRVVLRKNRLTHCAFGIWIHESDAARIIGNIVEGTVEGHPSNRGNGIHLFDGSNLEIRDNTVTGGRDGIYISACEDSLIQGNITETTRFGVHYMFSYDNRLINNISRNNTIGYALMQSRNLVVIGNTAASNTRNGLLFRDAQYCKIENNTLRANGEGMFFYSSTDNTIKNNRLIANEVGVKVWAGSYRNNVSGNSFIANRKQVFFVETADLYWGQQEGGNYWSDYLGWDQDGDGFGDRPYRVNSFSSHIVYKYPAAALLLRSPSLELLTHLEQRLPVFRVPTLIDQAPQMKDSNHEKD